MHTDDTPCPRHPKRHGDPFCDECRTDIHQAITDLPALHTRLLETHRWTTEGKNERRPVNADPASPSPLFDFADELASSLRDWAQAWADHLADTWTARRDPRPNAAYLTRHRKADLLASPLALDLGQEMTRLHGKARYLVGDVNGEPRHIPVGPAPCPYCETGGLWREDGTELVQCDRCGPIGALAEYEAHRAWLCQKYTAAIPA